MSFFKNLLGRSEPPKPDLDQLFALPDAALTLEAATDLRPTGVGSVAFRAAEGGASAGAERDISALLDMDEGPKVERTIDEYGYTWLVVRGAATDMSGLVTDLHAVNTGLEAQGFGPLLLCSTAYFTDGSRKLALVYLYKRGSFYPFAPAGGRRRDNALELQVRGLVADDLKIESDLSRWSPLWGAPGL